MKYVKIEWFDAQSSLNTLTLEECPDIVPNNTVSVGMLAYENKKYVILCFTDFLNGYYKHWVCIPKRMIVKITELKEKKK